jgi:DNA-binding GntR family transcriptional regulator
MLERRLALRLADAIATGAYRPGEWLKQVDLAASFGATRFEVRKALEELVLRKAVVHIPEKGYRVGEPTAADISQSHAVRVILETAAAQLVLERIDDSGLQELERLAADFAYAVEHGSPVERNHANHLFHDRMYEFAGNPMLSDLIREVRDRVRGAPMYLWPSVQSMRRSVEDHERIITALRDRDSDRVADVIRQHIMKNSS